MINYSSYILGNEVFIGFYDEFKDKLLYNDVRKQCDKYNINLMIIDRIDKFKTLKLTQNYKIVHFILRLNSNFQENLIKEIMNLRIGKHNSCSIAFSYKNENESLLFINKIEEFKINHGDCINIMRPDIIYKNVWTVSSLKILDNVICDTIRIKYKVNRICNKPIFKNFSRMEKTFFETAAHIFDKHKMYHRSPTDGYFAIRSKDGFFITCTKTRKDAMFDLNRISEVINYDETKNLITYKGQYLPSSDSIEAAIMFRDLPYLHSIIHTHDSIRFTRNRNVIDCSMVGKFPYGEALLGHELTRKIKQENKNLIVMEEHGEIFVGTNQISVLDILEQSIINSKVAV